MRSCCSTKRGKCQRKSDKKTFTMPRKFSRTECRNPRGFTMRASCAPYRGCGGALIPKLRPINYKNKRHKYKLSDPTPKRRLAIDEGIKSEKKKTRKAAIAKKSRFNVLRIYRKNNNPADCRKITRDMKYIDHKYKLGKTKDICKRGGRTKNKYFFNPYDPKRSFDVYKDKNPRDTIPIKYTTLDDVKQTIKKLERLYKSGKYPHKRIWQVAMIMKVRLEQLRSKKPKQYSLSKRYYDFLKKRTKTKKESDRKKMLFKV